MKRMISIMGHYFYGFIVHIMRGASVKNYVISINEITVLGDKDKIIFESL